MKCSRNSCGSNAPVLLKTESSCRKSRGIHRFPAHRANRRISQMESCMHSRHIYRFLYFILGRFCVQFFYLTGNIIANEDHHQYHHILTSAFSNVGNVGATFTFFLSFFFSLFLCFVCYPSSFLLLLLLYPLSHSSYWTCRSSLLEEPGLVSFFSSSFFVIMIFFLVLFLLRLLLLLSPTSPLPPFTFLARLLCW